MDSECPSYLLLLNMRETFIVLITDKPDRNQASPIILAKRSPAFVKNLILVQMYVFCYHESSKVDNNKEVLTLLF